METVSPYAREKLQGFRSSCHRFQGLWRSLAVRVAWARVGEIDMVVHLHASLETTEPDAVPRPPYDPSVAGYTAEFHVLPAAALDRVLDEMNEGSVTLGGRTLAVGGYQGQQPDQFRRLDNVDSGFAERSGEHWLANPAGAEVYLNVTCNDMRRATREALDHEKLRLRWNALPIPFRDIDDVLMRFFGIRPSQVQGLRFSAFAAFRATVPVRFTEETRFDGKELRIEVSAPETVERKEVAVGLIANAGESRRSLAVASWESAGSGVAARMCLPADSLHRYALLLTYKGVCLEIKEDSNPALRPSNPVLAVHRLFEREPDFTKRALRGEGKDRAGDFEHAVGSILYACGLPPLDYSAVGQHEIDLVAVLPERRLAVCVECTTGLPDLKNKLTKLYERSEAVKQTLGDFEVVRAIATCRSEDEIPDDQIKIAIGHGTALLTRERLQELEAKAHSKIAASETIAFIKGCIPQEGGIWEALRKHPGAMGPPRI